MRKTLDNFSQLWYNISTKNERSTVMKLAKKVEFSEAEKKAIRNCIEVINCDEINCDECPFVYNCGCMLKTLREIIDD